MTQQKNTQNKVTSLTKKKINCGNAIDRHYMKNSSLRYIRKRSAQKYSLEAIRTMIEIMRNYSTPAELKVKIATILLENARYHANLNKATIKKKNLNNPSHG